MLGEPPLNRSDDTRAPGSGGAPAGHHLLGGRWPQRTQLPDEERCLREALTLRTWGIAHRPSGPLSAKRVQGSTAPASEVCQEEVMTGEGPGPMIDQKRTITSAGEDVQKHVAHKVLVGMENAAATLENSASIAQNIKHGVTA